MDTWQQALGLQGSVPAEQISVCSVRSRFWFGMEISGRLIILKRPCCEVAALKEEQESELEASRKLDPGEAIGGNVGSQSQSHCPSVEMGPEEQHSSLLPDQEGVGGHENLRQAAYWVFLRAVHRQD